MSAEPGLVADIGGTNARFALVQPGELEPRHIHTLKVADFANIDVAIEAYLERVKPALEDGGAPRRACLAIACPVTRDRVEMTNSNWLFSKAELRKALGFSQLEVINDYAALAYAAPHLGADELHKVGGGDALQGQPLALLGPGTGLGVGGLVSQHGLSVPVVTEGGHVDFAPVNELEIEILRVLWQRHPHVSVERLLSGMGLTNLYQALASIRGQEPVALEPAEISRRAFTEQDRLCMEVLESFCAILGSVAGNMALSLGAQGGVYITGGIIPRMLDFFTQSAFRQRFEDKGRFQKYLAAIPTFVVIAEQPGLIGAAAALKQLAPSEERQ